MVVKILGTGCAKCKKLETETREVALRNNISAEFIKVEDIQEIMKYGILRTPGLVINEKVVSSGIIPKEEEILAWLNAE